MSNFDKAEKAYNDLVEDLNAEIKKQQTMLDLVVEVKNALKDGKLELVEDFLNNTIKSGERSIAALDRKLDAAKKVWGIVNEIS